MRQFNFYLDDDTRLAVLQKLEEQGIHTEKGALAATIRTLLRLYADGTITIPAGLIEQEYTYTTTKNKRSKM